MALPAIVDQLCWAHRVEFLQKIKTHDFLSAVVVMEWLMFFNKIWGWSPNKLPTERKESLDSLKPLAISNVYKSTGQGIFCSTFRTFSVYLNVYMDRRIPSKKQITMTKLFWISICYRTLELRFQSVVCKNMHTDMPLIK